MATIGQLHKTKYMLGTMEIGIDFTARLEQIESLFSEIRFAPKLVRQPGSTKVDPWLNWCYPALQVDSKYRWHLDKVEKTFCYQFDGISSAETKNPPIALVANIKTVLRTMGYKPIRLGAQMTLPQAAESLSKCAFFVGCDSGFSHIAHSVGCPVYMYEGQLLTYTTHKLKQADVFHDLPVFLAKIQHWSALLNL